MVMKMRVYFVFDVKDEFINLYYDNARVLYNILKQLYYLKNEEVSYGYSLFRQLIKYIDKEKIDRRLYLDYHKNVSYQKKGNMHIVNNLYKDEVSRLFVKSTYMKIEVDSGNSSFFKIIKNYSKNYFVCDFKRQDYFFLSEIDKPLLSNISN